MSTEPGPTQERRDELILRIGQLWRGDWSGSSFDGRDGQDWLTCAVSGDSDDLDELEQTLQRIENSY